MVGWAWGRARAGAGLTLVRLTLYSKLMKAATLRMAFLFAASLLRAQPTPGSVDGVVMNTATNAPVAKAGVTLGGAYTNFASSVSTDVGGRFHFSAVAPGQYRLYLQKPGFSVNLGAGNRLTEVTVAEGQQVADVKLELTPYGVIAGRVTNEAGEPVRGIGLSTLPVGKLNGEIRYRLVNPVYSDDRGQFRLSLAYSGHYYVVAVDHSHRPFQFMKAQGKIHEEAYVGVLYPGVLDTTEASEVEVGAGKVTGGIDFHLHKAATYHIRGHLFDAAHQPMYRKNVSAEVCRTGASGVFAVASGGNSFVETDGSFDIGGMLPGVTCLVVSGVYLRRPVKVEEGDVDGIELIAPPSLTAPGVITFGDGRTPDLLSVTNLMLAPVEGFQDVSPKVSRISDGSFTVSNLVAGDFSVVVGLGKPTVYVKSIRFAGQESQTGVIHVLPEGGTLTIVLGSNAGRISGHVQTDGTQASSGMFILFTKKEDSDGGGLPMVTAITDPTGNFLVPETTPGEYLLVALDSRAFQLEAPTVRGTDPMAPLRRLWQEFQNRAVHVTVRANAQESVTLTPISQAEIEQWLREPR
jgi:hypothetical protein